MKNVLPWLVILLLAAMLAGVVFFWPSEPPPHQVMDLARPPQGGDFTLQSADGPVSLADFRGKVVLVYFGYTLCPDICPTNLAAIAAAFRELTPEELARVQGIFVSVDPERDTPDKLKPYAAYFHPNLTGVTGPPAAVAEIAARYGVAYRKVAVDSVLEYMVDHSAETYLLDAQGQLRERAEHATPPRELAARIRGLLGEE